MNNIIVRNLDDATHARLKREADARGLSVNALMQQFIRSGLRHRDGYAADGLYHDLDGLAGTWSAGEEAEFLANIAPLSQVDAGTVAMTAVALDSNAYSAFRSGHLDAMEIFSRADHLIAPAIVIGELRAGFAAGTRTAVDERDLTRFLASPRVSVQGVDERVASVYATVYLQLRLAGRPVPSNDLWIAASALVAGVALVTFDKHFGHVDGLRAVSRWSDVLP